jgi:hypothetical protein
MMLNLKAIDPLGNFGDVFYHKALHHSKKLTAKYKVAIYWTGIPAASMDAIDGANDHFLGKFYFYLLNFLFTFRNDWYHLCHYLGFCRN